MGEWTKGWEERAARAEPTDGGTGREMDCDNSNQAAKEAKARKNGATGPRGVESRVREIGGRDL